MKKLALFLPFCFCALISLQAQQTVKFADRDTCSLFLDLYQPEQFSHQENPCIIFVFGGGFIEGERNKPEYISYAKELNERGYAVACIDYRLGLKGANMKGLNKISSLEKAINMAVEDLYSATAFLIQNAKAYRIDTSKIVLCGSSAGAITVLQANYVKANRMELSKMLPEQFKYAGVLSFSGAIFSHDGSIKFKEVPAPMFIFHGQNDRLVTYKSIRFGKLGFFGANPIIKRLEKLDLPYCARRYEGLGHEVATLMRHEIDICDWFIKKYVFEKQFLQIDQEIYDAGIKPLKWGKMTTKDLYQ